MKGGDNQGGGGNQFLSHLCGDEVTVLPLIILARFLSHLCGDEEQIPVSEITGSISKSPVR